MVDSRHRGKGRKGAPTWTPEQRAYAVQELAEFVGESDLYDDMTNADIAEKNGFVPIEDLWVTFRMRCRSCYNDEDFKEARMKYLKSVDNIPIFHTVNRLKILQDIINDKDTNNFDKVNALRAALKETTREAEIAAIAASGSKTQIAVNAVKYEITVEAIKMIQNELDILELLKARVFTDQQLLQLKGEIDIQIKGRKLLR